MRPAGSPVSRATTSAKLVEVPGQAGELLGDVAAIGEERDLAGEVGGVEFGHAGGRKVGPGEQLGDAGGEPLVVAVDGGGGGRVGGLDLGHHPLAVLQEVGGNRQALFRPHRVEPVGGLVGAAAAARAGRRQGGRAAG